MKYIASLFALSLLISCHKSNINEITKVEFAQGSCLGNCVPMATSIDSSLNYKLYADSAYSWDYKKIGPLRPCYIGKATRQLWDELKAQLDETDYENLDRKPKVEVMDIQHFELVIYLNKRKIKTRPNDKLVRWFQSSYQKIRLSPTSDTLRFDTKLQLPEQLQ
jgi:hypothetical protein